MNCMRVGYWGGETVYCETVEVPILEKWVEVAVSPEVPYDRQGERLPRRGHRYYPTLVKVIVSDEDFEMHPDTARELARRLIEAADAADAIDKADVNEAGEHLPCDCDLVGEGPRAVHNGGANH